MTKKTMTRRDFIDELMLSGRAIRLLRMVISSLRLIEPYIS
jgi:hypothetical protein